MDIKQSSDPAWNFELFFEDEEVEAVGAAYREHIAILASKGNIGSISEYDTWIAAHWDSTMKSVSTLSNNPERGILEIIEQFGERTKEAIDEIPETTGIPAFDNFDIPERMRLGAIACDLAETIHNNPLLSGATTETDIEGVVKDFMSQLDDGLPEASADES